MNQRLDAHKDWVILLETTFAHLALTAELLAATQRFNAPTPVQLACIPIVFRGVDLACTAPTGEGKTAAFALPLLSLLAENPRLEKPRPVRVLVLAPTRELVAQIAAEFEGFARYVPKPIKIKAVFGGVAINPQMMSLRGGADVLVATPGRLLDLIAHNAVQLGGVCTLVLDEADRMTSAGFALELDRILSLLPQDRQTLWFSATQASDTAHLNKWLSQPEIITFTTPGTTTFAPALIVQRAISVDPSRRTQLLRHCIHSHQWLQVLVFVASKHAASVMAEKLNKTYPSAPIITAAALHGDLSQSQRNQALADFKAGRVQVLVATDVAARGLHIEQLPVVVNYDLPRSPSDFTHRIGRTGRAGQSGLAVSFVSAGTQAHFDLIQRRHSPEVMLELEVLAGFEPSEAALPSTQDKPIVGLDANGGIKGARPSKKDKLRAMAIAGAQSI